MIRIIKAGTRERTECPYCGCQFSFEDSDLVKTPNDRKIILCPQCETEIVLSQSKRIR